MPTDIVQVLPYEPYLQVLIVIAGVITSFLCILIFSTAINDRS